MSEITTTSEIKVRMIQEMGGDQMVVAAARVSTSGEEAEKYTRVACSIHSRLSPEWGTCDNCRPWREQLEESRGLINFLMKMRHGSVFEHSSLTFFVHAPVFVWREWHRSMCGGG